jgi:hypothetical protein
LWGGENGCLVVEKPDEIGCGVGNYIIMIGLVFAR